jgi:hypothetical protein
VNLLNYDSQHVNNSNSYAIFLNLALYSPTIELHQSHIRQLKHKYPHSRILAIICDGKYGGCSVNPLGTPIICKYCTARAHSVVAEEGISFVYLSTFKQTNSTPTYSDRKNFWYGSMSSVASHTRVESSTDLNRFWRFIYKRLFRASQLTFYSISNIIKVYKISHLYIYNGRFSCAKAAKEAARSSAIYFSVYDVRRSLNPYIHTNTDLHNVFECFERAQKFYQLDPSTSYQSAVNYFSSRGKSSLFGASYTLNMKKGDLGNIELSKKIITIYTSSDDEYRFLGKDWGLRQQSIKQFNEIKCICDHLDPNQWHVVIRIHPNQSGVQTRSLRNIKSLNNLHNVTVCDPDSPIDTYALLDVSDLIITFASSVSLEASHKCKTIIQIGPSPYSIIDIGYVVNNGYQAVDFVNRWQDKLSDIPSKDNLNAYIYANYLLNYSDPLPPFSKQNDYYLVDSKKVPLDVVGRILQSPEKFLISLTKNERILSRAFLGKCASYALSIVQGKYYTVK